MSEAKGLIFDINENEIMSHIEDGTLSQFLESWRNAQLIKLAKEPHKVNEEDVLKFYYCESEDEYYVGRRLNTMYYAKVNPKTFDKTFCMSRYLPWGKHIVDSETLWKEHTYPSEPKEIDFSEWLKGWCNKYLVAKEPQEEPNIPLECVDGSCPMALSDEYEERGMDVIHSCEECQYNNKEPLKCNSDLISRAKLIDNLGLKHGSSPLIALTSKMVLDTINNQPQVQPIVRTPEEIAEMFDDMTSPHYCEKCPNKTICETNCGVGCKQHWINWLTKKEV